MMATEIPPVPILHDDGTPIATPVKKPSSPNALHDRLSSRPNPPRGAELADKVDQSLVAAEERAKTQRQERSAKARRHLADISLARQASAQREADALRKRREASEANIAAAREKRETTLELVRQKGANASTKAAAAAAVRGQADIERAKKATLGTQREQGATARRNAGLENVRLRAAGEVAKVERAAERTALETAAKGERLVERLDNAAHRKEQAIALRKARAVASWASRGLPQGGSHEWANSDDSPPSADRLPALSGVASAPVDCPLSPAQPLSQIFDEMVDAEAGAVTAIEGEGVEREGENDEKQEEAAVAVVQPAAETAAPVMDAACFDGEVIINHRGMARGIAPADNVHAGLSSALAVAAGLLAVVIVAALGHWASPPTEPPQTTSSELSAALILPLQWPLA